MRSVVRKLTTDYLSRDSKLCIFALAKNTKNISSDDTSLPLVIVNPKSASGATRDKWSVTASELRAHFGAFSVAFTKGPGDGIDIAERSAKSGRRFMIACGGDGTINEVANGIIRSGVDVELGALPSGTGGDFRRTIGMPVSSRDAAAALRDGETRLIDAGRVTFQDHANRTVNRYFLNVSSVGLAPSVLKRVKRARVFDWLPGDALRGKANFAVSAIQEVISLDPFIIRIRLDDGDEKTVQTICFCIANSRYFGGGMMIAPEAKINDGLLDVVNIGDMSTAKIIFNALSLYRGTHLNLDEVKTTAAKKLDISAVDPSRETLIEIDGEMLGKLPATYEIAPNAIRVRIAKPRK